MDMVSPETAVAHDLYLYPSPLMLLSRPFLLPETICMSSLSIQLSAVQDTRCGGLSCAVNCLAQADTFLAISPKAI